MKKAYFLDVSRWFSKLTLRRLLNLALLWCSYQLTRLSGRSIQWGLPFTLSIEPTTACNLRCPECPSGLRSFSRPTGNLRSDFFRKTIEALSPDTTCLIFYFQGEPYIHPEFLEMVRYAADKKMYTITSTNGHFLDEEMARRTVLSGLDRLVISIDGTTQEVYEQYRVGGNLEKVLDAARYMVAAKSKLKSRTPYLVFQFLVVGPNEHQIGELQELAQSIGVDAVHLKSAQVYDYENGNALIPKNQRYTRYQQLPDGRWAPKHKLVNRCWKLWHASVLTWDGQVVPCCFDKDAQHRMGDLKNENFSEIWQGAAYKAFRKKILMGRDQIDICTNCSEGCKVYHD